MKKAYLIGRSGVHGNKELSIENEILIGRDASICQLVYPSNDLRISSVHCKVQNINGNIQLTDMGSTNGTFLETGVRLAPHTSQALQSGQGFYLGDKMNSFAIRIQEDGVSDSDTLNTSSSNTKGNTSGTKAFSIASMVLGIVGVCLFFLISIPLICGIVGVVLGAYALYTHKRGRGMAITGFVCSIIAIVVPLLILLLQAL